MYPSLHSKIYLFSQVGTGANARHWVSAYSSGNPTYQQARKGFNNLNIAVGDKAMFDILANYFGEMVTASRGELLVTNYFRSFETAGQSGNRGAGQPRSTSGPRPRGHQPRHPEHGQVQVQGRRARASAPRSGSRCSCSPASGVSRDIWRLAFEKGCDIDITYTQMSQRIKGPNGKWLANEDGEVAGLRCRRTACRPRRPAKGARADRAQHPGRPDGEEPATGRTAAAAP